jgi:hypothetical protein
MMFASTAALLRRVTMPLGLPSLALLMLTWAAPARADVILYYAGDHDPNNPNANGLANENDAIVSGSPTGASTYENFVVSGQPWTVSALFSNNLIQFTPTSAYWEIRQGMSEGNGGTLVASGTTNSPVVTPTGRSDFGYTEFTVEVTGLNLVLAPGTYWLTVTPENLQAAGRSFNSNTFGLNAIGTDVANQQFFNSGFFGANFTNANNEGVFEFFSAGVIGIEGEVAVPEPGSMMLFGIATAAAVLWRRRRLRPSAALGDISQANTL